MNETLLCPCKDIKSNRRENEMTNENEPRLKTWDASGIRIKGWSSL
jgi:hypothetical protein